MFSLLCSLLVTSLCWPHVASRHIVQQPYYSPYSDYSFTYSGPGPFHQPYQQHHPSFFSPPGTYFDQRQGILRPFPGGGVPVLVDYHKRCSDSFVGLKAHPDQQQYYYVCKPDCVIFGKCQNLQIFNATSGQCVQHPPPEYIPTCTGEGRFPVFSNCHLYFKCEEDLQPRIYSCPVSTIFSPASKKCVTGNKCTPTQISPQSSYIPEMCSNKFPPCFESGVFRSTSDCSLYYKCDLKMNNVFLQTRLKCPQGNFYDLQKKKCLPAKEVSCDCIQVAELVYPKPNSLSFQPAVYPAQYDSDSMLEGQYPVEQTNDSVTEISSNCETDENVATTIITPNELMEKKLLKSLPLVEYINIGEHDDKEQSKEEELIVDSSEETDSVEGSGFEPDSEELPVDQTQDDIEENLTTVAAEKTEDQSEPGTTIEIDSETTDEPPTPNEELFLTTDNEVLSKKLEEGETTIATLPKEIDSEETTTTKISAVLRESDDCENFIENEETGNSDTQNKQCLTKHKRTSLSTDANANNTNITSETPNEQKSNTLTLITTTTQLPITTLTSTTANLVTTALPKETLTTISKSHSFEENLLDSDLSFETFKTTRSAKKTTQPVESNSENPNTDERKTTSVHIRSVITNSLEDVSYEDILISEITKKNKADFLDPAPELPQTSDPDSANENDFKNLIKEITTNRPFGITLINRDIQEVEKTLKSETTTMIPPQATTIKSNSNTPNKEILLEGTIEKTTNVPIDNEDDEIGVLGSEIQIDDFAFATQPQDFLEENLLLNNEFLPLAKNSMGHSKIALQEKISTSKKLVTLSQVDLSEEDFIPVNTKNAKLNEISVSEEGFDDDFTTIIADKEITTTLAPTISNEILNHDDKLNEISLFDKFTTLRRRQTFFDDAMQATTQINMVAEALTSVTEQPTNHNTEEESFLKDEQPDELGVLDSETVIPSQDNKREDDKEEVSNNEITSAETNETKSNLNQQKQISHLPRSITTFKTTTQTPTTTTTMRNTTSEPSEKQTKSLFIHFRQDELKTPSPVEPSPPRNNLYYVLKTKPVINNNKINNELVAARQDSNFDSGEIPRLEIIAERPIDIRLSICPSTCDKNHKHNISTTGRRAVLLKWFARKSKQTLGFETGNEINEDDI